MGINTLAAAAVGIAAAIAAPAVAAAAAAVAAPAVAAAAGADTLAGGASSHAAPAAAAAAKGAGPSNATRPHIFMLLVDDWGHYDVGFRGNPEAVTPNMDALVAGGVLLDRFYAHKYCSPSRSAFQSGRSPVYVNVFNLDWPDYNVSDPVSGFPGIPTAMTTVSEVLKGAGYATAAAGKVSEGRPGVGRRAAFDPGEHLCVRPRFTGRAA
jgi:hypothetical protein